ncbi:T9SS type A sorting domain-containing protein [Larkinella bovis]|uniref:T9SS type A sorting domain-containing protein n=1 Tax=Larkinella bovis TaxID=683041 RepID=A0ABW0I504_9BACT
MKTIHTLFRCLLMIVGLMQLASATYGREIVATGKTDAATSSPLKAAATITGHPLSATVCPGQPTTLSVTATGTALTYQWRKNNTNLVGATAATYTIANVLPEDAGSYDVVVGSSTGPATSNPAVLTVRPYTLIPTPPVAQTANVGSPVTFSAVATGDITGYQWLKNDVAIPSATSTIFTIPSVTTADAGLYTIRVFAPCGAQTAMPVNLVVNGTSSSPITITEHPTSQTACAGGSATFRVMATGDNITSIRWRKNGTIIPGLASGAAYTIAPLSSADEGEYDAVLTNASGSVTSNKATLTVRSSATITSHPAGQTVCAGNSATFSVAVSGSVTGYQWRKDGSDIPGATNATYTVSSASTADRGEYDVQVNTSCGLITSNPATLVFVSRLMVLATPSSQTVCTGGAATFGVAVAGSDLTGYQWRKNGIAIPGATNPSFPLSNVTSNDAGEYEILVSNVCGVTTSNKTVLIVATPLQLSVSATPVSCFQGNTGQASVAVSGGTGNYTYRWNTGATTATINNLAAGTYSVVVTDGAGCSNSANVTVNQPTELVLTATPTAVNCFGGNDGSATASATGGTSPYNYRWNTGATTSTLTGITAGTYSVTVTDANGCQQSKTVTINQPTQLVVTTTSTAVKCFGGNDGQVITNVSGGTGSYRFSWNTGATSSVLTGITAGTYQVTVTDANGCQQTATAQVNQPTTLLTLTTSVTAVKCFNTRDGVASALASGGGTAYNYQWSTGANTPSISGLAPGAYSVQVTDNNGCIRSASVDISQPTLLSLTTSSTAVKCFGNNDGSANVIASGSVGNYTYTWNTGATTSTINSLTAGSYSVQVSDANGCQQTGSVEVTQPTRLLLSLQKSDIKCFSGNDGQVTSSVTGGVGNYVYQWNTGATTSTITGLVTGTYQLTITDANSCQQTASVQVDQPATLLTLTTSTTPARCFNNRDGLASVTASGGGTAYHYQWSTGANTPSISGLAAGIYSVQVTDNKGCVKSTSVDISQPTLLSLTTSSTAVKCFGNNDGSAAVSASGSVGNYTYVWNTGGTTTSISSLTAGSYSVQVTDANGCRQSSVVEVTQPTRVLLTLQKDDVKCFGGNDGKVISTPTGGVGDYTYRWSTGATMPTLTGLVTGTYQLTVADGNSCQQTASIQIDQPTMVVLSISSTAAKCFQSADGAASVTVAGGVGNYTYRWSNGATNAIANNITAGTYSVDVADANGCTKTTSVEVTQPVAIVLTTKNTAATCFQSSDGSASVAATGGVGTYTYRWSTGATTPDISGINAGTYQVAVTDANSCVRTASVDINQPTQLMLAMSSTTVKCFGGNTGTATVLASGSVGDYTYRWNTGATTSAITSLTVGNYQVSVTDRNNCQQLASVEVKQPTQLVFSLEKENVKCFGGSDGKIILSATGGVGGYQVISNGTTTAFTGGGQHVVTGLPPASYQLIVADANACQATAQTALIEQPKQAVAVTLAKASDPRGFGLTDGSISVEIAGGTPQYQTSWKNGVGTIIGAGQSTNGGAANELTQLGDETYTITIQDANYSLATQKEGCMATLTQKLTQPPKLTLVLKTTQPVSCFGRKDAQIQATADGGVPMSTTDKYSFTWQQQIGGTYSTLTHVGPTIQNLPAGNYLCIVTDKNDITQQTELRITEPTKLVANASGVTNNLCYNDQKGTAVVQMQGGTLPYRVDWSNGASGASLNNLKAGRYLAIVSDQNGCSAEVSVRIQEPTAVEVSVLKKQNPTCDTQCDGSIQTATKGGLSPYSFSWNNGQTGTSLANLCGGSYTLSVRDANGCQVTAPAVELIKPASKTLTVSSDRTICEGQTLQLDATQPGKNTYNWTLPAGTTSDKPQQTIAQAGQYAVTVTDSLGCSAQNTFTIRTAPLNSQLLFLIASQGIVNDTIVVVNVSSGDTQFEWLVPASARVLSKTSSRLTFVCPQAGTYTVGLRGSNGTCEAEISKTITIKASSGRRATVVEPTATAIVVYPNPTSGQFKVQVDFGIPTKSRLSIINIRSGQFMYTTQLNGQSSYEHLVDLPDVEPGIYIVQIATNTQQLTKRIIVTR